MIFDWPSIHLILIHTDNLTIIFGAIGVILVFLQMNWVWWLGICINAASVKRLWSCMGFLQTKSRNRLMVCIKYTLLGLLYLYKVF